VLERLEHGLVRVLFIDFGNKELVSRDALRVLTPAYVNIAPFAYCCSLWSVSTPTGGWQACNFQRMIDIANVRGDKVLDCFFVSTSSDGLNQVILLENGKDVAEMFEGTTSDEGDGVFQVATLESGVESASGLLGSDEVKSFATELTVSRGVFVVYVKSPVNFFVQVTTS